VSGGYVIFFRHSMRDTSVLPTSSLALVDDAGDCVPGSELTVDGMADARALGAAIRRLGITIDQAYASPTCRTTQMASLMFDKFATTRALAWPGMWLPGEEPQLTTGLRDLLARVPAPSSNTVLISHNDVLQSRRIGVDITLDQAEAAVFLPDGDGSFRFVGRIKKNEWIPPMISAAGSVR
jgi:bisphosphoglycerate-dependent phosphoglycerate mutase